jgi:argininosuccinate lyase
MSRLWEKNLPIDERIHLFTVGEDPELDRYILVHDMDGTAAHVRGLGWIGALPLEEVRAILEVLQVLRMQAENNELTIPPELEDGHTLIESLLTEQLPEIGGKVHLGRSRNDQVATAVRLWLREQTRNVIQLTLDLTDVFLAVAEAGAGTPMPGYTHLRRAMPSSLGQWAAAFGEALLEEVQALLALDDRFDRCPLGSAAGFGAPLDLDREYVATLLGFTRVQISTIDVQNSRGRYESAFVHALCSIARTMERALIDLLLFSTEEFGFVKLPAEATTGSSIMPQKRNPDVLELSRGRCRELLGLASTLDHLASGLGSSYHRDYQLLKSPLLRANAIAQDVLSIFTHVLPKVSWNASKMEQALSLDMFATQLAYERAREGVPFRQAYREVAEEVNAGTMKPPTQAPPSHIGSPGDLKLWMLVEETKASRDALRRKNLRAKKQNERLWDLTTIESK